MHTANRIICVLLNVASVILLSSCDSLAYKFYGIKEIDGFDETKYETFVSNIPNNVGYTSVIGTAAQFEELVAFAGDTTTVKNLHQPVQLLYFQNGSLVSYHVNCAAPAKWRGLDWNHEGRFDTFPPKSAVPCEDTHLTFTSFEKAYGIDSGGKKTVLVVFWTTSFERVSSDAIKTAFNNIAENNCQDEVVIYLINNDETISRLWQ